MADILVVFHSRSGHCRMLAETLGRKRHWPLGEVTYGTGPSSYGRCARDALLRRAPGIRYEGPDPANFDVLVLVSPIWCWRLSPPMRGFLRSLHGERRNVAVLSCMGGSGAANAAAEVQRLVDRPVVAQLALRQDEVEAGKQDDRLRAFADGIAVFAAAHARPKVALAEAKAA
jgi:hypothetical protein